jgi:hypothetical protein
MNPRAELEALVIPARARLSAQQTLEYLDDEE